jgi:hypothetical protein
MVAQVALYQAFLRVLRFPSLVATPSLLHTHLSTPHEVCDSSDKAAHYHTRGTTLVSSSVPTLGSSAAQTDVCRICLGFGEGTGALLLETRL